MADTTALKNRIRAAIKSNDNQEITGPVLQQALLDMVDELNGATETEASARQSGDSTLQQGINTERQQRQDADAALSQRITQEEQRAEAAFDDLDMIDAAGSQVSPEAIDLTLRKNDGSDQDPDYRTLAHLLLPTASNQKAGLMSADMQRSLCKTDIVSDSNYDEIVKRYVDELYVSCPDGMPVTLYLISIYYNASNGFSIVFRDTTASSFNGQIMIWMDKTIQSGVVTEMTCTGIFSNYKAFIVYNGNTDNVSYSGINNQAADDIFKFISSKWPKITSYVVANGVNEVRDIALDDSTTAASQSTSIEISLKKGESTLDTLNIPSATDSKAGLVPAKNTWDIEPNWNSDSVIKSKVLYKSIGEIPADYKLNMSDLTITDENINLLWDGSKYITRPSGNNYRVYVVKLSPGIYKINGTTNYGIANSYPVVNGTDRNVAHGVCKLTNESKETVFTITETCYLVISFVYGDTITLSSVYKEKYYGIVTTRFVSSGGTLIVRNISSYITAMLRVPKGVQLKTNLNGWVGFSDTPDLQVNQQIGHTTVTAGNIFKANSEYVLFTYGALGTAAGGANFPTLEVVQTFEEDESNTIEDFVLKKTLTKANNSIPYTWNGTEFVYSYRYSSYIIRSIPGMQVRVPKQMLHSQGFYEKPKAANILSLEYVINTILNPVNCEYAYVKTSENTLYTVFCFPNEVETIDVVFEKSIYDNPLSGKKIVCFGDSITEFADTNNGTWPKYMGFYTNSETYNLGIGGTRIAPRKQNVTTISDNGDAYALLDILNMVKASVNGSFTKQMEAAEYTRDHAQDNNVPIIERAQTIDFSSVDVFIIFGGANDFTSNVQKGNYQSNDEVTTCGALNKCIELLCTNFKKAIVVIVTPEHRTFVVGSDDQYPDTWANANGDTLWDLAGVIEETGWRQHCPTLNLMKSGVFNNYNHSNYFTYTERVDNAHPYSGWNVLGKLIGSFVSNIMVE